MRLFESKTEKKTVSEAEANQLEVEKKGKKIKYLGDGKWLVRVQKPKPEKMTETPVPKEVKVGRNIPFEFSRLREKIEDIDKKLDTVAEKLQFVLGTLEARWGAKGR